MVESNKHIDWVWKPNISLGPFKFEMTLSEAMLVCTLTHVEFDPSFDSTPNAYIPNGDDDYWIYFEKNGPIENIICDSTVMYEGTDLSLFDRGAIERIFGQPDSVDSYDLSDGVGLRTMLYYDELGLTGTFLEDGSHYNLGFSRFEDED